MDLLSMYYVPTIVLSTFQHFLCNPSELSHKGRYCYSHFTNEGTETQTQSDLLESCIYCVAQLRPRLYGWQSLETTTAPTPASSSAQAYSM